MTQCMGWLGRAATTGALLADLGLHLVCSDPVFAPVLSGSAASTSDRLPAAADLLGHPEK